MLRSTAELDALADSVVSALRQAYGEDPVIHRIDDRPHVSIAYVTQVSDAMPPSPVALDALASPTGRLVITSLKQVTVASFSRLA